MGASESMSTKGAKPVAAPLVLRDASPTMINRIGEALSCFPQVLHIIIAEYVNDTLLYVMDTNREYITGVWYWQLWSLPIRESFIDNKSYDYSASVNVNNGGKVAGGEVKESTSSSSSSSLPPSSSSWQWNRIACTQFPKSPGSGRSNNVTSCIIGNMMYVMSIYEEESSGTNDRMTSYHIMWMRYDINMVDGNLLIMITIKMVSQVQFMHLINMSI
jgi:hypothetical protein